MAHVDEKYVYGTAARKLEYDVYEENKVLKRKKQANRDNKAKVKVVFSVFIVFVSCLMLMYRYAVITDLNYRISESYKHYNDIRNENSRLVVEIGKEMSLTKVKEIAEKRLGMQKPDRYQVVHIRVPKSDFTVVADTYKSADKTAESTFAVLIDRVRKYAQLLY